ncbi:MAG: hypothetical protein KBG28_16080 [Kofleriaceae bacterium]|nr:hypothetical protein [Kofleriaceae bacterium]MBP9205489.1 hypothetical protein [Kofleriaceae bacterium]
MRAVAPVAIAALVLAVAGAARATPSDDLGRARDAFRAGDFGGAVPQLNLLLYPRPRLAQPQDLIEAHVLLGVSLFEVGEKDDATRELEEALYLSAELTLDPTLFSPAAVRFFDTTKRALEARNKAAADARRYAEDLERLRAYKASLRVYEVRPYYVNFVPFGAGQLQNGHRGKGLFFAASQGVTGAASAGIWLYLVSKYGFGGQVPPEDASDVRLLQQVEIGTGAVFLGLYVWSAIDAMVYYKPRAQIGGDDSLLPEELRDLDKPTGPGPGAAPAPAPSRRGAELRAPRASRPSSTPLLGPSIAPLLGPSAAGLTLTWEH